MEYTVGHYLATRLTQLGLNHVFAVAGDYNLSLLDEMAKDSNLEQVYCCNELNCGFAAEGYARSRIMGASVVTFSVGAFSAFNAAGGAFAENLPMLLISGAPNNNDYGSGHILHHTMGYSDYRYQIEMAKQVTCVAVSIAHASEAPCLIDHAIRHALRNRKPAYIEISCNIASAPCPPPGPITAITKSLVSDAGTLKVAAEACLKALNKSKNPVIVIGGKARSAGGEKQIVELADKLGCAVTTMAQAKGFFPEEHAQYVGTYWGEISAPGVENLVAQSDCRIYIGAVFNDYSTVGWTCQVTGENDLFISPHHVRVGKNEFSGIYLDDFLAIFAPMVQKNPTSLEQYRAKGIKPTQTPAAPAEAELTVVELCRQIQGIIDNKTTLFLETGDSWFHGMHFNLPNGARVESEMQWGHIGWSVPSMFGYAVSEPDRRNIMMVGDGSFQLTAQEVCQMIRQKLPVIIILINNRGYTIEVKIHDGPYNRVKNWDYAGLINVFNAEDGKGLGLKAKNGGELAEAMKKALTNKEGPTLIEVAIDPQDCSPDLVVWGKRVQTANSRPPRTSLNMI